jgi:integrase
VRQNGSFSERRSAGCANGRVALGVETSFSVRKSKRLGIRLAAGERPTAVLARNVMAILRQVALQRAQITKQVSYHTFRHTFGTLLNANGENPKVVQELLRHASLKVTTDVYMQAVGPQKREAQSNLVKLVRNRAVLEIKPA